MTRTSWQRARFSLLVGSATVLVGGLLAAEVADGIIGCGSVDPTDPANYSSIRILNDTSLPVIIDDCRGAYCQLTQPQVLQPGQQLSDHAACGATGAQMTSWRVTTAGTRRLGYIAAQSPRSRNDLVYRVSNVSAHRFIATTKG